MIETVQIPITGYLRLPSIIGDKKQKIPALIPVSRTVWFEGVRSGKYPKPVKLSERTSAWRVEDILTLIEELSQGREAA